MRRTRTAASDSVSSDRSQPPPGRSAPSTWIGHLAGLAGHGVEQVAVGHGFPSPGNAGIRERNAGTQGNRLPTRRARRARGQLERPTGNEEAARVRLNPRRLMRRFSALPRSCDLPAANRRPPTQTGGGTAGKGPPKSHAQDGPIAPRKHPRLLRYVADVSTLLKTQSARESARSALSHGHPATPEP